MKKHRLWTIVAALTMFGMMLVGCQPQTVTVEVAVKETVEVIVEKTVEVITEVEVEVPVGGEQVHFVARCKAAPGHSDGRCFNLVAAVGAANAVLAEAGDDRRIELEIIQDDAPWGDYKTEFELAFEGGEAPDIICSGHEHIGDWATAGYLVDLTDMIPNYPEFEDIIDSLWGSIEMGGSRWGVPQDAEARPFFYSKILLRELGWTEEEIESLDERVAAGEYTWEDMFDTAEEAVKAGIVEEGDGWWHRPANGPDFLYYYFGAGGEIIGDGDALIFDQDAALKVYQLIYDAAQVRKITRPNKLDGDWDYHKEYTSTGTKVLFVFEGTWRYANWGNFYLQDQGGMEYLFENMGYAPIPAQENGTEDPITLTHPLVYMVSSQSKYPDLALLLISKATTKELNTPYAIQSGHLGILKSQSDYAPYVNDKFLSSALPLLEFTTFLPNSPYWSRWSEAYYLGIQATESGDLTPEEALEVVVDQLQNELGDSVVIVGD